MSEVRQTEFNTPEITCAPSPKGREERESPGYYYFADQPGIPIPWQKIAQMLREAGHDVMVQPGFRTHERDLLRRWAAASREIDPASELALAGDALAARLRTHSPEEPVERPWLGSCPDCGTAKVTGCPACVPVAAAAEALAIRGSPEEPHYTTCDVCGCSMLKGPRSVCSECFSPEELLGWRPIETAPKDGGEIIVFRPDGGVFTALYTCEAAQVDYGSWDEGWFTPCGEDLSGDMLPTHWMPLPDPPRP